MPVAAIREALFVSSAVCAEASKPVIVYCASSRPRPQTNQKIGLEGGRAAAEARSVHRLREDVGQRLVPVRDDDQDDDDERDTDHVPVRGDRVQARRDPDVEDVNDEAQSMKNAYSR